MATDAPGSRGVFLRYKLVLSVTFGGAFASMVVALAVYAILHMIAPAPDTMREAGLAIFVALAVGLPLSLACGLAVSRVRKLHGQAQRLGQNDGLTSCFNEATFSALVDSYSNGAAAGSDSARGTILLINVEDMETVNDRFGYSWGNEALVRTAEAIRKTIRAGDFVGRVSGTQFGVFLPGSDETSARGVANRIYENVRKVEFFPTGMQYPLSIRAGAVIVSDKIGFDELLRRARHTLATTQETKREWIEYAFLTDWQPEASTKPQ